jgi:hypothetical protein
MNISRAGMAWRVSYAAPIQLRELQQLSLLSQLL